MNVAVLGAFGQLGREFCRLLPDEATALGRDQADLTKPHALRDRLAEIRPEFVVNCAAYNLVDRAEDEPEDAFAVNAIGPRRLAEICRDLNCSLVHFSTDYVFGLDRDRSTPYGEYDAPGPVSMYGVGKLAGEYAVRSSLPRHIVIRTCGLYGVWGSGGKGTNFIETMLRLAERGNPIRIVNDQRCTPSYTIDVAQTVIELMRTERYGLYHITNSGDCTWFELANAVFELAGLSVETIPITSAEFGAKAARPGYSVLAHTQLAEAGVASPPPWRNAVAAYLDERQQRSGRN